MCVNIDLFNDLNLINYNHNLKIVFFLKVYCEIIRSQESSPGHRLTP